MWRNMRSYMHSAEEEHDLFNQDVDVYGAWLTNHNTRSVASTVTMSPRSRQVWAPADNNYSSC
jgi:hypothetical protein